MAIENIKKLKIAVHKKHKMAFLNHIYNLEMLHIDAIEGLEQLDQHDILEEIESDDKEKFKKKISKINQAISFMSRYQKSESLIESFFPSKIFIDKNTLHDIQDNFSIDTFTNDIIKIGEEESRLQRERAQLDTLLHEIRPYLFIDDKIKNTIDTKTTSVKKGIMSKEDFGTFEERLKNLLPVSYRYNDDHPKDVFLYLVYHNNIKNEMEEALNGITFIEHNFSRQLIDIPQKEYENILIKISEIDKRLQKLDENAERLSKDMDKLKVFYDLFNRDMDIYLIQDNIKGSRSSIFIEGWIREKDIDAFNKSVSKYKEIYIQYEDPCPDSEEDIPVSLSIPGVFKPFQMVVRLYAVPRFFEIDPTMILAPFFALFFALCLTDAGYGLLLVLLSLLLYKTRKIEKGSELLFKLMIFSGILTIAAGILTGGFMGYSLQGIPILQDLILLDLNSDTVNNGEPASITFLKIALLLGIVHVIFGIAIRGYMKIREGKLFSPIIDELNQIFLIIFGSIYVGTFLSFIELEEGAQILTVSGYGMLITSVIFILFIGRELKKPLPIVGKGLFEYYSFFSGTFGDVLSYARLMALGMATGVTAKSVGMISEMVFDIKIIGPVMAILIFVAGHLFMMIINALGSFIHTARLQYLEFFTKFYEGGGREFKAFKHNKKFIIYENDIA